MVNDYGEDVMTEQKHSEKVFMQKKIWITVAVVVGIVTILLIIGCLGKRDEATEKKGEQEIVMDSSDDKVSSISNLSATVTV